MALSPAGAVQRLASLLGLQREITALVRVLKPLLLLPSGWLMTRTALKRTCVVAGVITGGLQQ
jgi:hypothetical protein